jgi:hypothetical protein
MVSIEMTNNGFKELTASTRRTRFKVLNERYFQVLKTSIDSQTACQIFAYLPKLNMIFIYDQSLYSLKLIFKESFNKNLINKSPNQRYHSKKHELHDFVKQFKK